MLVWLFLACADEPTPGDPTTPTEAPTLPDLPPPACMDYAYLPIDDMGELVLHQAAPEISYDAAGVDNVLGLLGAEPLAPVQYGVDTWKIRYVTQDRGVRTEATAAVIVPRGVTGEQPLLLWEHFTMGAADMCTPSELGGFGLGLAMAWAAKLGVVVVAPDYIGMNGLGADSDQLHPYVIAEPTAIASLDAARAAIAMAEVEALPIQPDPSRVVVWGASQGGHATLWIDRYQKGYAPELTLTAVIAAIPPTDMIALTNHGLEAWTSTSETMVAITATAADWFRLDPDEVFPPGVADAVYEEMNTTCNVLDPANELDSLELVFTEAFRAGTDTWDATLPDWKCAFEANTLNLSPLEPSGAPIMMVLAGADDLAWSPPARADAERFCAEGASISLIECEGLDHEDAAISTLQLQIDWLEDRLAGLPQDDACALPSATYCEPL